MITHKLHFSWIAVIAMAFAGCLRPSAVPEDQVQPPGGEAEQVQREKPMEEPAAAGVEGSSSQGNEEPVAVKQESKVQLGVDVDVDEDGVDVDIGKDGIQVDVDEDGVDVQVGHESSPDHQADHSDN